ncbi:Do family serine endopeptidase [Tunturibacter empetritectus]|uniref:Serine protease Do n=1 Tax=Tunturiibacter lichenicola TaxID=2051959 RepID=A0A7W8JAA1_9BACT|nr:Do family serine endopeptidase [Edaphobacter lichenicola]MBB5345490.1 serine protease Do [Edaphobacter lichenicola]
MSFETNKLVGKAGRVAVPAGAAAALVLAAGMFVHHNGVHAAVISSPIASPAPMDDNSVSSLVALDNAVEAVAARVTPAVVNVAVTSRGSAESEHETGNDQEDGSQQGQSLPPGLQQFFGQLPPGMMQQRPQQPQLEHGIGSGIIISPDGYIVTNNHVVDGAVEMRVTLHDRRVLKAKLVGRDPLTDIAVIKVEAHDLPSIAWGDSTKLKPGQTVLAFGSPFGYFQFSVTRGIVSAVDRQNPYRDDARKPGGYIQTDAAINPGNSGGPLVNARGELVGISTFIISNGGSFAGAGFAIPSQMVRATAEQLIKTGAVHHGYLGISMNDVTPENASFFNLKEATGAIVTQVTPDSPAAQAGLKNGDVIDELNGQKVINGGALQVAVSEDSPGTQIALGIIRNGSSQTVNVKVGEYHKDAEVASNGDSAGPQKGKLGLAVAELTAEVRQQLHIPSQVQGVAIQSVRPGSPADDASLAPGDVILEVDRHPVTSAEQFVNAAHANAAGKDLLLLVWSQGGASYRVVHPDAGNQSGM